MANRFTSKCCESSLSSGTARCTSIHTFTRRSITTPVCFQQWAGAIAQQKDAVDSQIRQQLDALGEKYDEAFNNGDAADLAPIFTGDAVLVTDTGLVYGREAIEKYYADLFKQIHISNQFGKSDEYSPHIIGTAGNELWSNGEWSLTYRVYGGGPGPIQLKGYWSNIYLREGDAWKTRMGMSNVTP